ncbi:Mpo1-like protein [Brevundimonas sp.]|uniref:Mpo1-like protein n=1 Tax=Brevundimonas sp. TaxID=1871086 RepID=UPI003D1184FD
MSTPLESEQGYASFEVFYPFYISQHQNRVSRRIHVIGTGLMILAVPISLLTLNPWWLAIFPAVAASAWIGHFVFEKNRPLGLRHFVWSLMGDFRLFFETVTGRRPF